MYTNPTWNSEIQFYTSVVQPVCVLCICLQFHKCTFSAKPFEEVNTSFQFEPEPQSTVTMHLVSDEKLSGDLNDSMLLWHLWRLCVVLKMHISLLFMVEHIILHCNIRVEGGSGQQSGSFSINGDDI